MRGVAVMEELRQQLELLIDRLSELADAKRMYGSVRRNSATAPSGSRQSSPAEAVGRPFGGDGDVANGAGVAAGDASTQALNDSDTQDTAEREVTRPRQQGEPQAGPSEGQQQPEEEQAQAPAQAPAEAGKEANEAAAGQGNEDVEALLRRADECSGRMLALLSDEPYAATSHQPLRGAALLAAGLSAFLRGGTSGAAVRGLQAAVKLRPLNPTAWNCLAHSYWERGDLFMAGSCLRSGLRHCPSVAAHQMMSLLVRQQGGAAGAALLQPPPPPRPASAGGVAGSAEGAGSGGAPPPYASAASASTPAPTPTFGASAGSGASASAASATCGLSAALTASLAHARRALEMDLENGYSWYVLAMAQMADYFRGEHVTLGQGGGGTAAGSPAAASAGGGRGRGGRGELHRVLAAFAQAERCSCSDLPDLYYNRAALHAFTQDFEAALHDYSRAAMLDPGLPAPAQMESLLVLLGQLTGLVAARGGVKERYWATVAALLAGDAARGSETLPRTYHERLTLKPLRDLQPGSNRGLVLLCRPLVFVSPPLNASGTLYLVCVESGGCCFVLALTHIHHDAFNMTQLLAVVHPELKQVDLTWPPPPPVAASASAAASGAAPQSAAAGPTAASTSGGGGGGDGCAKVKESGATSVQLEPAGAAAHGGGGGSSTASGACRTFRFPLLMVGCDPGGRSCVLVDGVPLHHAAQTPVLHHVMRAA